MRGYHLNFSPSHFHLLLFLVICLSVRTLGGDPCSNAFCGEGTCVPLGSDYNCSCNHGWKKDLGIMSLRSCVLPNCTIDLGCGNSEPPSPPPPPPPPLTLPPFLDPLSACFLIWCGEGTCLENGAKHTCQCNNGSTNLLDLPDFPCFKKCSLGADCNGILLSATTTLPPPPPPPPNGSDKISKTWSRGVVSLSMIVLVWIMYD